MLSEEGYSGLEIRETPSRIEVIISATRTQSVLGEKGRRIKELTSLIQHRFNYLDGEIELFAEKLTNKGLCAVTQAESLRFKLLGGLPVRRACYGVLNFIMESGAKGATIIVSGKLRGQRAKSMKFTDGVMIHAGNACKDYIGVATRHVLLRQGILGIKVQIMYRWDPSGKLGPKKPIPDHVSVIQPPDDDDFKIQLLSDLLL
ncbi:hypothetical protein O3M35_000929 [Rhynocoris fuscipes]|uniref:40S ribosomal protein S3 n=1 Tax=Rhynocoris fuscipes TaxID=488301 RepID=A0AAW1DNC6_9HEMI